jgi:gliding motility-associated-like protein
LAAFSVNNDIQCLDGNQFAFTNGSTVSGGSLSYNWNFGNGVGVSSATNPTYTYPAAGSYLVTLDVNTPFNCTARVTRTVIVRPMPIGNLTVPANTIICEGGVITLTASGGDSYQWFLNGNQINGAVSSTYAASQPGTYTVNLINSFGCARLATTAVTLTLVKKPVVDFSYDSYCLNKPVQFTDLTNTTLTGPVNYLWNFGNGNTSNVANPQQTYTTSGSYTVSLQVTPTACTNLSTTATKTISFQSPSVSIRYPALNAVSGQPLPLLARSFTNAQYEWTPATSLNNALRRDPVFNGTAGQTYLIRITTPAGCEVVDTQQVRVFTEKNIYLPDVFSPNGDGKNDRLTPILVGVSQIRFFRVYDRWGQIVFQTSRFGEGWDGWFRGVKQPMETYTWVVEGIDIDGVTIRKTGSSILIR